MINWDSVGLVSTQLKNITSNGTKLSQEDIVLSVDIIKNIVNNVMSIEQEVIIDVFKLNPTTITYMPSGNNLP